MISSKRRVVSILILSLLIFTSRSFAQDQSRDELEKKKQQLISDIASMQSQLDQTENSKSNGLAQLALLKKKIAARQELISDYNSQVNQLSGQAGSTQKSVNTLTSNLDELKKDYANMVVYAYKHRSAHDRLLFLFSAHSFNDAMLRLMYLRRYDAYRRMQAGLIVSSRNDLNKKMKELRSQQAIKQKLMNEQVQQAQKLADEKSQQDKMVKALSKKEKQLQSDLAKKKKEQDALQKQISDVIKKEIEEQRKKAMLNEPATTSVKRGSSTPASSASEALNLIPEAAALSASFQSNEGKLPWPVEKGTISETFGEHPHPILENVTTKNNGIDIKTSQGASARAVFKGTVVSILTNPGYHKAVIIKHGEYFTVYSNLSSVSVKQNDEVNTKQSIGTVYTDPSSGDTILHMEVWKGTTLMDPAQWLMQK